MLASAQARHLAHNLFSLRILDAGCAPEDQRPIGLHLDFQDPGVIQVILRGRRIHKFAIIPEARGFVLPVAIRLVLGVSTTAQIQFFSLLQQFAVTVEQLDLTGDMQWAIDDGGNLVFLAHNLLSVSRVLVLNRLRTITLQCPGFLKRSQTHPLKDPAGMQYAPVVRASFACTAWKTFASASGIEPDARRPGG